VFVSSVLLSASSWKPVQTTKGIRGFYFMVVLTLYIVLAVIWPSVFGSELAIARAVIAEEGNADGPVAHRLIAATAIGEIRGMSCLFLILSVSVLYTPLSFAQHAVLNFSGWVFFTILSTYLVGELNVGRAGQWMEKHHVLAVIILFGALTVFVYRAWLNEMASRQNFLLQIRDARSKTMLIFEKEEKARLEANMNSWVCHEVSTYRDYVAIEPVTSYTAIMLHALF
jgi:hypothetical protein